MRRPSAAAAGIAGLVAIAACGGAGGDADATVEESWFMQDGSAVHSVTTVTVGTGTAGRVMILDADFLDAEGATVARAQRTAFVSWDGQEFALPVDATVDSPGAAAIESMTASVRVTGEAYDDPWPEIDPSGSVSITADGPARYTATFLLHRLPDETQTGVITLDVGVACYDVDGRLIGGGSAQPRTPADGGLLRVEAPVAAETRPDSCEAFAARR